MTLKAERIEIGPGINLNLIRTEKFKSNLLSYYFIRPLEESEATKNALLPIVLKRGTEEFDNNLKIQKKLEETYGAGLSISINKRGEKQVLRFTVEMLSADYVDDKDYIYDVVKLLKDIIYNPVKENGYFKKDYVQQEKENLKNRIESRINDKRSYAIDRTIEEMCKDEKFKIYPLGTLESLKTIDEKNLYSHYKDFINTSPLEIFYVGEYDDDLVDYIKQINVEDRHNILQLKKDPIKLQAEEEKTVKEEFDVNQGKLVLGYRAGLDYTDDLYTALLVANDIFGGGANSKLFKNVREKESLAYYVSSTIYKYKTIMMVDAGIEFENFEKTVDIIKKELESMKNGDFTEEDINISKKSIKSSTESINDSAFLMSEYVFSKLLSNDNRDLEQVFKDVDSVTKADVIKAISKVDLEIIYFMKNKN